MIHVRWWPHPLVDKVKLICCTLSQIKEVSDICRLSLYLKHMFYESNSIMFYFSFGCVLVRIDIQLVNSHCRFDNAFLLSHMIGRSCDWGNNAKQKKEKNHTCSSVCLWLCLSRTVSMMDGDEVMHTRLVDVGRKLMVVGGGGGLHK